MLRKSDTEIRGQREAVRARTNSKKLSLLVLAAIVALCFTADSALRQPAQLYLKELGATPIVIGLATTLVLCGMLLASYVWGKLCDRYSKKALLFIMLSGGTVAVGVLALLLPASGVLLAILLRALLIMGVAPVSMAYASRKSSRSKRGRSLSYINSARSLGMTLGRMLVGFSLAAFGFRWTFLSLAILPFVGLLLLFRLPGEEGVREQAATASQRRRPHKGLIGLCIGGGLREMGISGSLSLVYVHMVSLEIPASVMGVVSSLAPGVSILAMLVFGRMSDRVGRRRVFLWGFALSPLPPLLFALAHDVWTMIAGYLALGMTFAAFYTGCTAYIGDVSSEGKHGTMLGLFEAIRAMGGILGPIMAGLATTGLGFYGMFIAMAAIVSCGFLLVLAQSGGKEQDSIAIVGS